MRNSHAHGSGPGHEQVISIDTRPYACLGARAGSALLFDIDHDVNPPAEAPCPSPAQDAQSMSDDMQPDTGLLFDIDDSPVQPAGCSRQQAAHVPSATDCQPASAPPHRQAPLVNQDAEEDDSLLFDIDDGPVQQPNSAGHLKLPLSSQGNIHQPSTSLGSLRQAPSSLHPQPSLATEKLQDTLGSTVDHKSSITQEPTGNSQMRQHRLKGSVSEDDIDAGATLAAQQTSACSQAAPAQQSTVCMRGHQHTSSVAPSTQATVQLSAAPKPVLPVKRPAASQQAGQQQQQVPKPSFLQQQQQPKTGYMAPAGSGAFKAPRRVIPPALAASAPAAKSLSAEGAALRVPPPALWSAWTPHQHLLRLLPPSAIVSSTPSFQHSVCVRCWSTSQPDRCHWLGPQLSITPTLTRMCFATLTHQILSHVGRRCLLPSCQLAQSKCTTCVLPR